MDNVYFIVATVETERTELDTSGSPTQVTVAPGTIMNTVIWDGVTPWEPGEGLQAVRVSDYVPPPE